MSEIEKIIEDAWKNKEDINQNSEASIINSINQSVQSKNKPFYCII